jgi:hypothetical protein
MPVDPISPDRERLPFPDSPPSESPPRTEPPDGYGRGTSEPPDLKDSERDDYRHLAYSSIDLGHY